MGNRLDPNSPRYRQPRDLANEVKAKEHYFDHSQRQKQTWVWDDNEKTKGHWEHVLHVSAE